MKKKYTFCQYDKDYAIGSDSLQWMVKQYSGFDKENNKQIWKSISYYATESQAIKYLRERLKRECGAESFDELIELTKNIDRKLEEKFGL